MKPDWSAVHPRARGEHRAVAPKVGHQPGSSPRSRGTFFLLKHQARDWRFIPALAGNMSRKPNYGNIIAVHPRARGEHADDLRALQAWVGSSPRSRGTFVKRRRPTKRLRFIPALAGNMELPSRQRQLPPVHPRARGEHHSSSNYSRSKIGSSPRSRGTSNRRWP